MSQGDSSPRNEETIGAQPSAQWGWEKGRVCSEEGDTGRGPQQALKVPRLMGLSFRKDTQLLGGTLREEGKPGATGRSVLVWGKVRCLEPRGVAEMGRWITKAHYMSGHLGGRR